VIFGVTFDSDVAIVLDSGKGGSLSCFYEHDSRIVGATIIYWLDRNPDSGQVGSIQCRGEPLAEGHSHPALGETGRGRAAAYVADETGWPSKKKPSQESLAGLDTFSQTRLRERPLYRTIPLGYSCKEINATWTSKSSHSRWKERRRIQSGMPKTPMVSPQQSAHCMFRSGYSVRSHRRG
jgi:hypothetical protein